MIITSRTEILFSSSTTHDFPTFPFKDQHCSATAVLAATAAAAAAWAKTSARLQGGASSSASAVPAVSAGCLPFTGKYRGNESVPVFVLKTGPACCGYRADRWGNAHAICQALHPCARCQVMVALLISGGTQILFFSFFFGRQMRQRR